MWENIKLATVLHKTKPRKDEKFKGAMLDQRGTLYSYAGAQGTKHQINQTDAL